MPRRALARQVLQLQFEHRAARDRLLGGEVRAHHAHPVHARLFAGVLARAPAAEPRRLDDAQHDRLEPPGRRRLGERG